jgi:hypothetical protein
MDPSDAIKQPASLNCLTKMELEMCDSWKQLDEVVMKFNKTKTLKNCADSDGNIQEGCDMEDESPNLKTTEHMLKLSCGCRESADRSWHL